MIHGNETGYSYHKCRCKECKKGHATYQQNYRAIKQSRKDCVDCSSKAEKGKTRCFIHLMANRQRLEDRKYAKLPNQTMAKTDTK